MTSPALTYSNRHLVDFLCVARRVAFLHAPADATNGWFEYCDRCNTFSCSEECSQPTILGAMEVRRLVADELKKELGINSNLLKVSLLG